MSMQNQSKIKISRFEPAHEIMVLITVKAQASKNQTSSPTGWLHMGV